MDNTPWPRIHLQRGGFNIVPSREERMWRHYTQDRALRETRKQIKHNRKPKRVRRKDWIDYAVNDPEAFELTEAITLLDDEPVMPRGERERRRASRPASPTNDGLGNKQAEVCDAPEPNGRRGSVIEVSTGLCRVRLDHHVLLCGLRGSLSSHDTGFTNVVAVGDEVIVSEDGVGGGVVKQILPRRSVLARPDVFHSHLQQVIVANIDQILIVAAWRNPHIWLELIDRYLIAAGRNCLGAIICVNKIDLAEDQALCHATLRPYVDLGYRVIFTSAQNGEGIDELQRILHRRTTVLAGLSGVGKSTLLTLAQPGLALRTGSVNDDSGEGRHTTTQVSLLPLSEGGFVVDTPGIREFGLSGLRRQELSGFYPDIQAVEGECQFGDCSHAGEPGCAVRRAVSQGRISEQRYHNYRKIRDSLPA